MIREALYKITENCPCNCSFCEAREKYNTIFNKTEIELNDWIRISDNLVKNGLEVAIVSGGEALLKEHTTFELIKYLKNKGVFTVLNASGVLFNNIQLIDKLQNNFPDLLVFSIDSAYPKQHDSNRNFQGLFDTIINTIKYLKESNDYPIAIRTVITKQNFRQLPKIIKDFNEIGVDCIKITNIENDKEGIFRLSLDELKEFNVDIRKKIIYELNKCKFKSEQLRLESIRKIENFLSNDNVSYEELSKGNFAPNLTGTTKCDLVERFITIQSNGEVLPCCESEHHNEPVLGNLLEDKLEDIFNTSKYKDFVMNRPEFCKRCTEWQNIQINFSEIGKKVNRR